ncbi:MAG TPA: pyruvate kinase [Gemmatimonadaceae bacterium]|nr:pyruvate kinase [Gemmatimonadaceae bacterium]
MAPSTTSTTSTSSTTSSHTARTKIVCTIGPASSSPAALRTLIMAGMNVTRINFSHGTHEQHAEVIRAVRAIAQELKKPVALLGDLQGPRIRIGDLPAPVTLIEGTDIVLAPEADARNGEIPVTYGELASDVKVGDRILINDGLLDLVVMEEHAPRVVARVVHGGSLVSHKGINLPGVHVSAPSITEKDRADIDFAVAQEVDYLALSFVRRAEDIQGLRKLIPRNILVVAKIEKDTALANIDSIMRATDAVMVARGDLGVELPFEEVPIAQKRIISLANSVGRPVITATQMLESMIENPRPTRAEASDVANAILDGTDAVMLSAETATGQYPELAVRAMSRIISEIESHPAPRQRATDHARLRRADGPVETEDAIAAATVAAVRMLAVPLIIVFTKSGFSARVVASHRPEVPILAVTDVERTFRQLALVWGVQPELVPSSGSYTKMVGHALEAARRRGLAMPGERVVVTAGVPFDQPGSTNLMKVEVV